MDADASASVILEGCAVGEVYPGRGPFVVDLYPTAAYSAAMERRKTSSGRPGPLHNR